MKRVYIPAGETVSCESLVTEQQTPEANAAEAQPEPEAEEEPYDEELTRIIDLFKLSRKSGYTLRLVPGTPEENAPIFDFASESIIPPAA